MALSFSSARNKTVDCNENSIEICLALCVTVAEQLGYHISQQFSRGIIAVPSTQLENAQSELVCFINGSEISICSSGRGSNLFDFSFNANRVKEFSEQLSTKLSGLTEDERLHLKEKLLSGALQTNEELLVNAHYKALSKSGSVLDLLKPTKTYYFTPLLIYTNLVFYIAMVAAGVDAFNPNSGDLLDWGANMRHHVLEGEWWRLISACFIHVGFLHLLLNMYALASIGVILEPFVGRTRFLTAYLASGVIASFCSIAWSEFQVSAGASGAIFGMYGVLLALLSGNLIEKSTRKELLSSTLIFVLYNLVYGLQANSNIDNAAHFGGLVSGFVFGLIYLQGLKQHLSVEVPSIGISMAAVLVVISGLIFLPNNFSIYEAKMKAFDQHETKALGIYNMPSGTGAEEQLMELTKNGLPELDSCLNIIKSLEAINLPGHLLSTQLLLKDYCETRKEIYRLFILSIQEQTGRYDSQIQELNSKLSSIVQSLNS